MSKIKVELAMTDEQENEYLDEIADLDQHVRYLRRMWLEVCDELDREKALNARLVRALAKHGASASLSEALKDNPDLYID
jgi:uncharacterized heparinase superfamily protein